MERSLSGLQGENLKGIQPFFPMIPEVETLRVLKLPGAIADAAARYVADPDDDALSGFVANVPEWIASNMGVALVEQLPWNERVQRLLRFFIQLSKRAGKPTASAHHFLLGVMKALMTSNTVTVSVASQMIEELRGSELDPTNVISSLLKDDYYRFDWTLVAGGGAEAPFKRPLANLIYQLVVDEKITGLGLIFLHTSLVGVVAQHHPELVEGWLRRSFSINGYRMMDCWSRLLADSTRFDLLCRDYCVEMAERNADVAFRVLHQMNQVRKGSCSELLLDIATRPWAAVDFRALDLLLQHKGEEVISIMTRAFNTPGSNGRVSGMDEEPYGRLFEKIAECWSLGGERLFWKILENCTNHTKRSLVRTHLRCFQEPQWSAIRKVCDSALDDLSPKEQADFWSSLADHHAAVFSEEFGRFLVGKSKPLREVGALGVARARGVAALGEAYSLLDSKKADLRTAGAHLLEHLGDASSVTVLRAAMEMEDSDAVRMALRAAIDACGGNDPEGPDAVGAEVFELDAFINRYSKGLKHHPCSWLNISLLPELTLVDGKTVPEIAVCILIAKQGKHKTMDASPDLIPLLDHIDRTKSGPFAGALVEGFLQSEQVASDRWALALGGLLGDSRIIAPLLSQIAGWCENSRHKLAEYAAQAISLLPGNEPLMVLDTLANRYRNKFKNVGKACAEAFQAAATARGITTDELGDLVVPDFGFDGEGARRFEWPGGGACAELGLDFKLSWFDPDSGKSWKSLPAGASEEVKTEVKTVTKLLRETVKSQTARLEMALVRQRRWDVSRWRELYEGHALLKSFAGSLVWGVYDAAGVLLRTFRRYPNGLLADAGGNLEELADGAVAVGMVHPLEMDEAALEAWRGHLSRFKVKQPFPQVERPVELMDPLHGNRKSIGLTDGRKLSAGTFRSRAERRGWTRGSVVDAGGISSYYKLYPGAGVEVILPTENFWVGCDPMEEIELRSGYFARSGSVERGSYVYDEPSPEDPRVLRFDQVPPVVWSETMSDLNLILEVKG